MKSSKVWLYSILIVLGTSLFLYLNCKHTAIPYDDAYSVFMIKKSYADILDITAQDVHPPLYYWALKTFSLIFGDSLFTLRLFSTLGVLAILLLGCFSIRRLFGDKVGVLFILLTIIFPVTQYLATDIRMYSWTMFFVLACALQAYHIYLKGNKQNWILFFITSLCAAYLHNYGLLSALGIYSLLFIFLFKTKRKLYYLLACTILFTIIYSPWLFQLVAQLGAVNQDYWIKPLTLNDLFLHIYYFYSPKEIWLPFTDFTKVQMMVGLIILMSIQLLLTLKVIITGLKEKDKFTSLAIVSFVAFIFPIAIGLFISVLFMPILVTRYMTCSFGLFVLSLSFVLAKVYDYPKYRVIFYGFLLLLLFDAGVRYYSGLKYYSDTENIYNEMRTFVNTEEWQEKDIIANEFSYYALPRLQLIMPCKQYYLLEDQNKVDNMEPFILETRQSLPADDFILIHLNREAVNADFRQYQQSLNTEYVASDSLYAGDIYFYKMKLRRKVSE